MASVGWWRDMCRGTAGSDVAGQCVSAGVCCVEVGHELAVGRSCRREVDDLVLEMGDFPGERVDVGGGAEPGFPPCLLAEGLGEPLLKLLYAGGQADCALVSGEQVCLQRFPCDGRAGCGSGCCGRGGLEVVNLGEEVTRLIRATGAPPVRSGRCGPIPNPSPS
ncbi:MAG TPA: hypothetical protein VFQ44_11535 [Streptosporangiaceae bacterium]|nr:hypothetical protein [Streptosporangiaceae bacterium]